MKYKQYSIFNCLNFSMTSLLWKFHHRITIAIALN